MSNSFLQKQNFDPNAWGIFVNPFYIARSNLRNHIKSLSEELGGKLLDVGCGTKPYKHFFNVREYIGMEIKDMPFPDTKPDIDVFYDGHNFPFPDNTFDSVLCNQVLEHVFHPDEFVKEIARVLKPEGKLLLTVPFSWDEHEQPFDYARYSSFGIKHLLQSHGFKILEHRKSTDDFSAIFQLINAYFYKLTNKNRWIRIITTLCFMSLLTLKGIILGRLLPRNPDFYLDNVILAEKNE